MRTFNSIGLYFISLFLAPFALSQTSNPNRLPTGVMLDPAGERVTTGNMPLGIIFSPDGEKLIISLGGWRERGIQVIDVRTRQLTQTINQAGAFFGLVFSHSAQHEPDSGRTSALTTHHST